MAKGTLKGKLKGKKGELANKEEIKGSKRSARSRSPEQQLPSDKQTVSEAKRIKAQTSNCKENPVQDARINSIRTVNKNNAQVISARDSQILAKNISETRSGKQSLPTGSEIVESWNDFIESLPADFRNNREKILVHGISVDVTGGDPTNSENEDDVAGFIPDYVDDVDDCEISTGDLNMETLNDLFFIDNKSIASTSEVQFWKKKSISLEFKDLTEDQIKENPHIMNILKKMVHET